MTSRISRVMNAIRRQPGTPVARGELTLDPAFARDFLTWRTRGRATAPLSDTDLLIECCRSLQLDLVCLQAGNGREGEPDPPGNPVDVIRFAEQDIFVFWVVNGSFQTAMTCGDMMAFLMKNRRRSRRGRRRASSGYPARWTAAMAEGVAAGAHGIIIADDIAYQQSTYISPTFVEQHLLPVWREQTTFVRDMGVPVFFHSDGNLNTVLPYIAAAGFDGLQCVEPSAGMDLAEIKRTYGGDLCLMGNVDPALLSEPDGPDGAENSHDRLRRAVIDVMAEAGDGGLHFRDLQRAFMPGCRPPLVDRMYRLAAGLDPASTGMSPFGGSSRNTSPDPHGIRIGFSDHELD